MSRPPFVWTPDDEPRPHFEREPIFDFDISWIEALIIGGFAILFTLFLVVAT